MQPWFAAFFNRYPRLTMRSSRIYRSTACIMGDEQSTRKPYTRWRKPSSRSEDIGSVTSGTQTRQVRHSLCKGNGKLNSRCLCCCLHLCLYCPVVLLCAKIVLLLFLCLTTGFATFTTAHTATYAVGRRLSTITVEMAISCSMQRGFNS